MLTEICQYLKNWFNRRPQGGDMPKYSGSVTISDGEITFDGGGFTLAEGQYFRIMGSLFNDGVHKYLDPEDKLKDEAFDGVVWSMAVPPEVEALAADISAWMEQYGTAASEAMSPFASESFGGYSYTKASGVSSNGSTKQPSWMDAYAARLAIYKKL